MAAVVATDKDLADTVASNAIVAIDLWAAWCRPHRTFARSMRRARRSSPTRSPPGRQRGRARARRFVHHPVHPNPRFIRGQVVLFSAAGAPPEDSLVDGAETVTALDTEEAHGQVRIPQAIASCDVVTHGGRGWRTRPHDSPSSRVRTAPTAPGRLVGGL